MIPLHHVPNWCHLVHVDTKHKLHKTRCEEGGGPNVRAEMIIAKAPRALNPTKAPYRPSTLTSMIGCEVKAIYDANGLK